MSLIILHDFNVIKPLYEYCLLSQMSFGLEYDEASHEWEVSIIEHGIDKWSSNSNTLEFAITSILDEVKQSKQ